MKALLLAYVNLLLARRRVVLRTFAEETQRTQAASLREAASRQAAETNFHAAEMARRDASALRAFLQGLDELLIGAGHSTEIKAARRIIRIALGKERQAEA